MDSDRKTVLIVEDDPQNMRMFREFLEIYGYDALCAENGEEGVLKALEGSPDVILMDIQLPVLDGFGALKRIRSSEAASTPVIAVTAHFHDREALLASGFDDFLPKPVDLETLNTRIEFYSAK